MRPISPKLRYEDEVYVGQFPRAHFEGGRRHSAFVTQLVYVRETDLGSVYCYMTDAYVLQVR